MNNEYDKVFSDVKEYLDKNDVNASKLLTKFPFRKRADHIFRVYVWTKRLLEKLRNRKINEKLVLIAALFHDIGYALSVNSKRTCRK